MHTSPSISLRPRVASVWVVNPDEIMDRELLTHYHHLLSPEEQAKLTQFKIDQEKHNALITRALVRTVLTFYSQSSTYTPPQYWQFAIGEKGKPEVTNAEQPIRFNLSHTKGLIVCAVTAQVDVGVDVENVERRTEYMRVAAAKFAPAEFAELISQPKGERRSRFFDYWTLKESYVKAVGCGLSIPLDSFSFSISNYEQISIDFTQDQVQREEDTQQGFNTWQSWLFNVTESHRLALTIRDSVPYRVDFYQTVPLMNYWPVELPIRLIS